MIAIKIKNLVKKNGKNIILDIDELNINRGETFALIGPNGSGKSTLLRVISLLDPFHSGNISILGNIVTSGKDNLNLRRRISTVFQSPLMYRITVRENISSGLNFRRVSKIGIKDKVDLWMKKLGISHLSSRIATQLSGGEVSRVGIARALVTEPEILLLDEPFSELDPLTGEKLIYELKSLLSSSEITTIFVTHVRDEALILSDKLGIIFDGKILQQGKGIEVFNHPVDDRIARFVGVETILDGEVEDISGSLAGIRLKGGEILKVSADLRTGERVKVCIRPENVVLAIPEEGKIFKSSFRNSFLGRINKLIPYGFYFKVELDCNFPLISCVTKQAIEEMNLKEGKNVKAYFKATSIHLIKVENRGS